MINPLSNRQKAIIFCVLTFSMGADGERREEIRSIEH